MDCPSSGGTRGGDKRPYTGAALLIAALLAIFSGDVSGQRKADIGLIGGSTYYMGDINSYLPFYRPSFAAGAMYRYNFNPRNSLRFSGFYHSLSGNDADFPSNFRPSGAQEFAASFVDLALNFEFNWKAYQTAHRKTVGTPYVFAGLGFNFKVLGDAGVRSHLTVPFGAGYKVNLGRWLSGGVEVSPRRAMSDYVDGVSNPGFDDALAPIGNRDWYFFTGVFVTYKIFKFLETCPTYEEGSQKRRHR